MSHLISTSAHTHTNELLTTQISKWRLAKSWVTEHLYRRDSNWSNKAIKSLCEMRKEKLLTLPPSITCAKKTLLSSDKCIVPDTRAEALASTWVFSQRVTFLAKPGQKHNWSKYFVKNILSSEPKVLKESEKVKKIKTRTVFAKESVKNC